MLFRRKPKSVTAEQLVKDRQPWPNGTCICTSAGFWGLHVHTPDGPKYIVDGSWVTRDLEGNYDCLSQEEFETLFEPMP